MSLKLFLRLTACTTGIIGLTLVVMPSFIANLFLPNTDHAADIFIRFLGSSLIGYTYLNWQTAKNTDASQVRATLIGNFSTLFIAFVLSLIGVLAGDLKAAGLAIVALHGVFGSGFGWYLWRATR
jgi:hypothetical protein